MTEFYIIGTLHGFTKEAELEEIIRQIKPSQIMVEIPQSDLKKNKISGYPGEMIWAVEWARKSNIPVLGMDAHIDVLVNKETEEVRAELIDRERKIIEKYRWQDFNNESYLKLLHFPEDEDRVDSNKARLREEKMLENINKNAIPNGTIIVLTGAGHIPFFEEQMPDAIFPLKT